MDYASARERLKLIDEEACRASLASFKPGDDPAILNGLSAANQTRYKKNVSLLDAIYDRPTIPDGYRLHWIEDFTGAAVNTSLWSIYGPGNNESWGQGQGRLGYYSPDAVSVKDSLLTITTRPDPARRLANGLPAWQCGFLATKTPLPAWCHVQVRWRISEGSQAWDAPFWMTHSPNGSEWAEVDTVERFWNEPGKMRQAIHLRSDDSGKVTYNVPSKLLGLSQTAPMSVGWHVSESYVEYSTGTNNVWFSQWHDGRNTYSFSTGSLGLKHHKWIDSIKGWNGRICSQVGGAGGMPTAGAAGPWTMDIDWIAVSVPD